MKDCIFLIVFVIMAIAASFAIGDIIFSNFLVSDAVKSVSIVNTNSAPRKVEHKTCLWRKGDVACEIIDGHYYILTYIRNSGYGSYGIASIIHAESCPCKKQKIHNEN